MGPATTLALEGTSWEPWPALSRAEVTFYPGERMDVERITRRLFGRPLLAWQYAGLAGAPDAARVELGVCCDELLVEMGDPVANRYRAYHYVRRVGSDLVISKDGFRIFVKKMQRKGLGLKIFHRQVANAKALNVARIETLAGRREDENGYYTWPRFGCDGPLPDDVKRALPPGLERARTVLDLMDCEEGRRWWRDHGVAIHVEFDLSEQSRSRHVFERYVRSKRPGWPKRRLENRIAMLYGGAR